MEPLVKSRPREMKDQMVNILQEVMPITTEANIAGLRFAELNKAEQRPEVSLPGISIMLAFGDPQEWSTEFYLVKWRFTVRMYFDLSLGNEAQYQYEEMFPEVIDAFMNNSDLNGTCDKLRLVDSGDPVFATGVNLLIKTIYVIPENEE